MTGKIAFSLVFAALVSCRSPDPAIATVSDDLVEAELAAPIYYERTVCFGRCPAFVFQWDGNDLLSLTVKRPFYEGNMMKFVPGSYRATINPEESERFNERILRAAERFSFSTLDSVYDSPMVTDLPSTILEIQGHRVTNRYKGPDLKDLYAEIEEQMATFGWQLQE